ncbi:hypothetical protein C7M61_003848 [Candidozyma pseudohaemuli]|uniref:Signal peptide peptidase n=1 Tax=Candidozyma pseudohaemuli TaxID=418784 RepID=A0A2P7YK88_9ASCO|nr:hypothetical protein C7M61_003848 [[Candida] pseudohaemulonii]PSK36379.1 hypothetical protein C7M61_003848 [[Candida] pseudohaemulonii]
MVNENSTFTELPILDKVAVAFPHYLYATGVDKQWTGFAILGAWATFLLIFFSYATVQQPKASLDPNDDKESPLWDPSDRDGSALFLRETGEVKSGNQQTISWQYAALMPVFGAGALFALDYAIRNWNVLKSTLINGYFLLVLFASSLLLFHIVSISAARNIGYWLGLKGNSAFFIKRTRLTYSTENELPLGFYDRIDAKSLEFSKEKFEKMEDFMWEQNNAKIVRLPKLKTKDQESAFVYDNRWFWILLSSLLFLAVYFNYNPALSSSYQLPQTNWLVSNAVASALLSNITYVKVGNVKVAGILLLGMFAYDIYFVFRSHLMMSVATGIDIPGKLVFPKGPETLLSYAELSGLTQKELRLDSSLLGLGDIMLPAIFASLCLRFDYHRFYSKNKLAFHRLRSIGVPSYFVALIVGYIAALVATVVAVFVFEQGQPALLYIVPSMLIAVTLTALVKGEVSQLWNYREELAKYEPEKEKSAKNEKKEKEDEADKIEVVTTETLYEFGDATDDSDDTFLIEDSTDADDDSDISDLETELGHLIQDQMVEVEFVEEESD